MKRTLVFLFLAILASGAVAEKIDVENIVSQLSQRKSEVNFILNTMGIPGPIKQAFGNETMNVFVAMSDGSTETVGVKTKDGKIEEIKYSGFENETLHVFISEETVKDIIASENPLKKAVDKLQSKEIKYKGIGVVNEIKFGLIDWVRLMLQFLAGLFGLSFS